MMFELQHIFPCETQIHLQSNALPFIDDLKQFQLKESIIILSHISDSADTYYSKI